MMKPFETIDSWNQSETEYAWTQNRDGQCHERACLYA